MTERYNLLTNEIKAFTEQFESDKSLEHIRKKYYRGTQVLVSPLVNKPTFMFIGINPGIGYYKFNNRNVKRFKPLQHFEYLHYNYQLATETRKVFQNAGLLKELKDAVKTNCYFFSTASENDLKELLSQIKKDHNIYLKCKTWLCELVNIIEPQLIICEGKSAFEGLVGRGKDNIKDSNGIYYTQYEGIPVIGYQRMYSRIVNKADLSLLIKETYTKMNANAQ